MKLYLIAIMLYIMLLMAFELTKFILEAKRRRDSFYMKQKQSAMLMGDIPRIRYFMESTERLNKYRNLMAIKARNYLKTKMPRGFIKNKRARILTYSLRLFVDALDEAVSRLKCFIENPEKAEIVPPERFQYIKDNILRQSFICLFSANGQTRESARSNLSTQCMMMHPDLTYFVWKVYKTVTSFKLQDTSYDWNDEGEGDED